MTGGPMVDGLTSVVVVTWNNLSYTKKCLRYLEEFTTAPFEIIVVDNGSTDGTVEWLRQHAQTILAGLPLRRLAIIANPDNAGFARAANQGTVIAKGQYLCFMNNDLIVAANWLPLLIASLEHLPHAAAVAPMGSGIGGKQDYTWIYGGAAYDEAGFARFAEFVASRYPGMFTETKMLIGCCLLVKRSLFDEVGGLDEGCAMGAEDLDLSLRLRLAGHRLYVVESVFVHHFGHATFNLHPPEVRDKFSEESWGHFNRKWGHLSDSSWETKFTNEEKWYYDGFFRNRRGYADTTPFRGSR